MKSTLIVIALIFICFNKVSAQIPHFKNFTADTFHHPAYQPFADTNTLYTGLQNYSRRYGGGSSYGPNSDVIYPANMNMPVTIKRIYVKSIYAIDSVSIYGFTVRMGQNNGDGFNIANNNWSMSQYTNTMDTVFGPATLHLNNISAGAWVPIDLDSDYYYVQPPHNLITDLLSDSVSGDGLYLEAVIFTPSSARMRYGNYPYTTGVISQSYKSIKFGFDVQQDWDAGLVSFVRPKDTLCTGINPVRVVVHNAGLKDLDSLRINWYANGIPQPTYYHTIPLSSMAYDTLTIGSYNFPLNTATVIKAWTSHPQGYSDVFNTNDTIQKSFTATKDFVSNFNIGIGNDTTICEGDPITLSAGSGSNTLVTFLWDDNTTNQTRSVSTGGTYYVTVTDTSGCEKMDTVIVTSNQPIVDLGNDTTICEGEVVIFDAQNTGATYLWDDNSTNQLRYASNAQTYYVTVTDSIGCTGSDTVNVSHIPLPSGQITATLVQGLTYNFDIFNPVNVTSALWNFGDGNTASGLFVTHTYNAIDTYNVSVLMYGVCNVEMSGNDEYQLIIGDTSTIHTTNIHNSQGIEIYPNPFDKGFSIKVAQDKGEIYNLKITDLIGRNVLQLSGTISELNNELNYKPTNWQNGQYILQLKNETTGEVQIKKLAAMR